MLNNYSWQVVGAHKHQRKKVTATNEFSAKQSRNGKYTRPSEACWIKFKKIKIKYVQPKRTLIIEMDLTLFKPSRRSTII